MLLNKSASTDNNNKNIQSTSNQPIPNLPAPPPSSTTPNPLAVVNNNSSNANSNSIPKVLSSKQAKLFVEGRGYRMSAEAFQTIQNFAEQVLDTHFSECFSIPSLRENPLSIERDVVKSAFCKLILSESKQQKTSAIYSEWMDRLETLFKQLYQSSSLRDLNLAGNEDASSADSASEPREINIPKQAQQLSLVIPPRKLSSILSHKLNNSLLLNNSDGNGGRKFSAPIIIQFCVAIDELIVLVITKAMDNVSAKGKRGIRTDDIVASITSLPECERFFDRFKRAEAGNKVALNISRFNELAALNSDISEIDEESNVKANNNGGILSSNSGTGGAKAAQVPSSTGLNYSVSSSANLKSIKETVVTTTKEPAMDLISSVVDRKSLPNIPQQNNANSALQKEEGGNASNSFASKESLENGGKVVFDTSENILNEPTPSAADKSIPIAPLKEKSLDEGGGVIDRKVVAENEANQDSIDDNILFDKKKPKVKGNMESLKEFLLNTDPSDYGIRAPPSGTDSHPVNSSVNFTVKSTTTKNQNDLLKSSGGGGINSLVSLFTGRKKSKGSKSESLNHNAPTNTSSSAESIGDEKAPSPIQLQDNNNNNNLTRAKSADKLKGNQGSNQNITTGGNNNSISSNNNRKVSNLERSNSFNLSINNSKFQSTENSKVSKEPLKSSTSNEASSPVNQVFLREGSPKSRHPNTISGIFSASVSIPDPISTSNEVPAASSQNNNISSSSNNNNLLSELVTLKLENKRLEESLSSCKSELESVKTERDVLAVKLSQEKAQFESVSSKAYRRLKDLTRDKETLEIALKAMAEQLSDLKRRSGNILNDSGSSNSKSNKAGNGSQNSSSAESNAVNLLQAFMESE